MGDAGGPGRQRVRHRRHAPVVHPPGSQTWAGPGDGPDTARLRGPRLRAARVPAFAQSGPLLGAAMDCACGHRPRRHVSCERPPTHTSMKGACGHRPRHHVPCPCHPVGSPPGASGNLPTPARTPLPPGVSGSPVRTPHPPPRSACLAGRDTPSPPRRACLAGPDTPSPAEECPPGRPRHPIPAARCVPGSPGSTIVGRTRPVATHYLPHLPQSVQASRGKPPLPPAVDRNMPDRVGFAP